MNIQGHNSPSQVDQRLALMQLSDSFFPSGSFTLSHGLESLIQSKHICSIQDLEDFLGLIFHNKVGSMDMVALRQAYRTSAGHHTLTLQDIDAQLFAQTLIKPNRDSQCKSGRALLMVARQTWHHPQLDTIYQSIQVREMHGMHSVIFAVVGQAIGLDEDNTVFAFLHNFLTGLCGAALRLGLIGHINAQTLLKNMAPSLECVARGAIATELDDMWSCTPFLDIAQLTHDALPQKLFST
ncbi:MAG: urease accessory UreF family protein [Cyanobacteria bacterium P01_F01_bin.150]